MRWQGLCVSACVAMTVSACAAGSTAPAGAPPAPSTPTPGAVREAPLDWFLLDATADGYPGISLLRAVHELLAHRQPKRTVLVAVIDNGVDTAHAKLRGRLWSNPRETPNGKDDDGDGYVDDIRGWNLIGGRDGKNVDHDTFELTRLVAQCGDTNGGRLRMPAMYRDRCPELQSEFRRKRSEAEGVLSQVAQIDNVMTQIMPYLKRAVVPDSVTTASVQRLVPSNDTLRQARQVYLQLASAGITPSEIAEAKKGYASQVQYGYNLSYNPRPIVGDDYPDTLVKLYGNPDVMGPDPMHGTHVAGIIGAARDVPSAVPIGIAQSVRILAVRAVPDGDERDKDIAYAIRYAADMGAQVINMSFGKAYSPYKGVVDAAVKYADSKGVLMVHAAGNEGADADKSASFPSPIYLDGGRAKNWIEVGSVSWKGADSLVSSFSNYGKAAVDIFAPGTDIYSTVPGGGYKTESGTSMASPVVAGVAALVMSYYPNLSAADVKRVILESATRMPDRMVARPGASGDVVKFGELSATGGIVNAYAALKLAEQLSAARP